VSPMRFGVAFQGGIMSEGIGIFHFPGNTMAPARPSTKPL
jgi:hypothetical protein